MNTRLVKRCELQVFNLTGKPPWVSHQPTHTHQTLIKPNQTPTHIKRHQLTYTFCIKSVPWYERLSIYAFCNSSQNFGHGSHSTQQRKEARGAKAHRRQETGQEIMGPPKGSMSAAEGGLQMEIRRARSSSGNANADQARQALVQAFQSADIDRPV